MELKDKWLNRVYNHDCIEAMKKLPNNSIDLVVTDPPYLHDKGGNGGGKTKLATSEMYKKDSKMIKEMSTFTKDKCWIMLNEVNRLMKKMNGFFFCNDSLVPHYLNWAIENKYKYTILSWNKPLSILNRERFSTNMEYIVRIYGKGTALNKLDLDTYPEKKDYYSKYRFFPQIKGKDKYHPTQKPIELINGIIELTTDDNDIVLDPYMGGGTTAESCIRLNRKFIGFELDEVYHQNTMDRIDKVMSEYESVS